MTKEEIQKLREDAESVAFIGEHYGADSPSQQRAVDLARGVIALLSDIDRAKQLARETVEIARKRGASIDFMCRQVDGYDIVKQVADEIEHGTIDEDGRAAIFGAERLPNSAERLAAISKELFDE